MAKARRRRAPVALNKKAPPPETWQGGQHPTHGGVIIKKQKNTDPLSLPTDLFRSTFMLKMQRLWQLNKKQWKFYFITVTSTFYGFL